MAVHHKSKVISKKRVKNKILAEVESEISNLNGIPQKKTKTKAKKVEKKLLPIQSSSSKLFDLDAIECQLNALKESQDSGNKKTRKKIRKLEFLKKRYNQMKSTEESLKLGIIENRQLHSDFCDYGKTDESTTVGNSAAVKDKIEAMKGIRRFVVFVGNLPKTVTEDDIKIHFNKVGNIKSVRIPEAKVNRKSGFAFIELEDNITFEKTLSMHHTMLGNKRINVMYTNPDGKNLDKKEIKKKNAKFDAMRKAGILTGSIAQNKKRSFRRKKKRLAEEKVLNNK